MQTDMHLKEELERMNLHKGTLIFCVCVFPEESKDSEDMVDKEESSATARPAKRARTSFTVDQLQVRVLFSSWVLLSFGNGGALHGKATIT